MDQDQSSQHESIALEDLNPDPRNARTHTDRNIATIGTALREVGAGRSVVVDENGTVLAGNATVQAAASAGITRVRIVDADGSELIAVRRSGLTAEQKRRLALFDNRAAEPPEWDTDVLASLAPDTDLSALWDDDELAELLASVDSGPTDLPGDPDDVPEPPEDPITRPGDLWELGPHHRLCGDATSADDVARVMDEEQAALVFTDPPYGVAYEGGTPDKLTIANDDPDDNAFLSFLTSAFTNMLSVTKSGGAVYVCHADSRGQVFRQAFVDAGWKLAQCLVWVKQSLVLGRQDYQWRHEPILYGWKLGAGHFFTPDRTQTTRKVTHSELSPKQKRAVEALLTPGDVAAAAQAAGVARETLHRWMRIPVFLKAVRAAEAQALDDLSRLLVRLSRTAAATLAKAMGDPATPPATRVRAADAVLGRLLQVRELATLEARVAELERAAGVAEGGR